MSLEALRLRIAIRQQGKEHSHDMHIVDAPRRETARGIPQKGTWWGYEEATTYDSLVTWQDKVTFSSVEALRHQIGVED